MGGNTKKPGKSEKNAVDFSIFGKIFQSFRESYILVPSHEERKWSRKSGKKIGISREKNTVRKESPGFPNL